MPSDIKTAELSKLLHVLINRGFSQLVLKNPETGEEKILDISAIQKSQPQPDESTFTEADFLDALRKVSRKVEKK